jgi:hypothetical protein
MKASLLARCPAHRLAQGLLLTVMAGIVIALCVSPKPWMFDLSLAKKVRVEHYVAVFSWWAALLNLLPLGALAFTARFWLRPLDGSGPEDRSARAAAPRWFWPLVGLAMVGCAALNAPRLGHGLWDDEEYTLLRVVLGSYRVDSEGNAKLKEVPWSHTLWYYGKPNNHFLNSIAGRLSNSVWRTVTRPKGLQFSETALRLPAFFAGVLSLGAWALLLRILGFPAAGVLAAWLIMLHPWHMRFVPELRGYAFVFLFLPLACWFALRALRSGGWGWWAGYALAQFGLFYSWPGAVLTLAVLNAGVLVLIATLPASRRFTLGARWLVATTAAGMAALQLYLPCVKQLAGHMDDWDAKGLGWPWVHNVASRLLTGMPWKLPGGTLAQTSDLLAQNPLLYGTLATGLLLAILAGVLRCFTAGPAGRMVALVFLVPGPATYLFARLKDTYLFEWYLVFMVPGLMAFCALGIQAVLELLAPRPRKIAAACAVLCVCGFAVSTHPARARLIAGPIQFTRESVLASRPTLNPHDPRNREILTVATLATPEIYDPNIRRVKSGEELIALIQDADRTGYPLFVNQGYANMLASEIPSVAAVISRPGMFERMAVFPGIEPMFDREILRYRPGSLNAAPR